MPQTKPSMLAYSVLLLGIYHLITPSQANGDQDKCKHITMLNCSQASGLFNLAVVPGYRSVSVTWTNKTLNSKGFTHYDIYWAQKNNKDVSTLVNCSYKAKNVTYTNIGSLVPGTSYTVSVVAEYGDIRCKQAYKNVVTKGFGGDANPCGCSKTGSNGTGDTCHYKTGQCQCKTEYTGTNCSMCTATYYLDKDGSCKRCGCHSNHFAGGSCKLRNDNIYCDCTPGYAGPVCDKCDFGYHVRGHNCIKCHCNGNADPNGTVCDKAGKCLHCIRNTTGDNCEKCKSGYIGDPVHQKNCTLYKDLHPDESNHEKYLVIVIAVCVLLAVVLITLTAICLYRHFTRHRYKPFGFWTVQLRDDHETLNFSDQMEYHDDQHGVNKREVHT